MGIPEKVINGIEHLEPLPITAQKLIVLLNRDDVDFKEIIQIVEYDGAIASNLLRVADSWLFGGLSPVKSLRDAVVRLGRDALLDIVLTDHLKSWSMTAPMYDLSEDELWLHGAASSLAVKAIERESHNSRIPQMAGIAALIHDIGKLIMVRYLNVDVSLITSLCKESNCTFVEAERELFRCDHAEVGGAIARKWRFPEAIQQGIELHHREPGSTPNSTMLDAVMLANLAAKSIGVGLGAEGLNLRVDYTGCLKRLGLRVEGFERACAQTSVWLKDIRTRYRV